MTISYTLDVSQTSTRSILKLLGRWRGSIWKAVLHQLAIWTAIYLVISVIYRFILPDNWRQIFDWFAPYLNDGLHNHIPLNFMLGFFVSFVVGRWGSVLNGLGWIDDAAINFAAVIRGNDEQTRILRRTLIRYMVLTQTLVLRDISLQVRKRFPTLDTLVAAGLLYREEMAIMEKTTDAYTKYWIPIEWCYRHLHDARHYGKIGSDFLLEKLTHEVQVFRHGLASLLKFDWVPVPLLYPQLIFLAVRLYFFICLFSRQFLNSDKHNGLWFPVATMLEFIVYMGWLKVAEALLNPLGEDDDDLECNYVIDKNLITGLTLVDSGNQQLPLLRKDEFWGNDHIAPLYSLEAAERSVHPFIGSASSVNLVKNVNSITMTPHKNKLAKMSEEEIRSHTRVVDVKNHNIQHSVLKQTAKNENPDKTLSKIRKGKTGGPLNPQPPQDIESNGSPERFDGLSPRVISVNDDRDIRRW